MDRLRKQVLLHLIFTVVFFLLITIFRRWFDSPVYILFWLGGALGSLLPGLDHVIHTLFLRPHELTSQRFKSLLASKSFSQAATLLSDTMQERRNLLFHSILFQIALLVLSFLVVSSSGNMFGRGLVLAFAFQLSIDQLSDLLQKGSLNSWFQEIKFSPTKEQATLIWLALFGFVLYLGFVA